MGSGKKKADPCIAQEPAHQNKTKNQLFIFEGHKTAFLVNYCSGFSNGPGFRGNLHRVPR